MSSSRCDICYKTKKDGVCPRPDLHVGEALEFRAETEAQARQKRLAQSINQLGNLPKHLRQLYEILKGKGIDLVDLEAANIERVKFWQAMHKDAADEAVITDLQGITLSPGWESGPKWPVVQPAKPVKLPAVRQIKKKATETDLKSCVILPDMQIGYSHTGDPRNPQLEPIHDERAIQIALSIIRELQPEQIVYLGDNLDLAEFGKYRQYPAFAGTTQASIDRAGALLAEIHSISPDSRGYWLEGNHEARLSNLIIDNAKAAFGLRRAGKDFFDVPELAVPNLLNFKEYATEYVSGYPAGQHYITKWLTAIHGKYVSADTATAAKYLRKGWDSVIYGHIHRIERMEQTRYSRKGPRTKIAASPGCLCRIDGIVPSTMGGVDINGRPVPTAENWQQGLMVVDYEDSGWYSLDQVTIWGGRSVWRGKVYESDLDVTYLHPSVL